MIAYFRPNGKLKGVSDEDAEKYVNKHGYKVVKRKEGYYLVKGDFELKGRSAGNLARHVSLNDFLQYVMGEVQEQEFNDSVSE